MSKFLSLFIALALSFASVQFADAQIFKRNKKSSKKEAVADSTKNKKVDKYTRMFVRDKSCITAKGEFITLHKSKGKLYFEFPKKYLGREMLLASTISEASDNNLGVIGYKPKPPMHVRFMQIDSTVYMTKVNLPLEFDKQNKPLKKAMELSSMDPILNSYNIVCQSTDSSSVVMDVTSLFVGNYEPLSPMGASSGMVKITGVFNSSGSALSDIKAFDDNVVIKSYLSYSVSAEMLGLLQLKKNEPMTMKLTRTLLLLPEEKMRPRISDSRIGIFLTGKSEINDNIDKINNFTIINRWNVQPKDTAAYLRGELVEPVKPIIFYLDNAFPELWREPIKEGVMRWNKAFEKIGFKNVVQVLDFPSDDPNFDPDNLKYSCIRYVPAAITNAMGPSWVDPSSGEIINSSIIIFNDVIKLLNQWRFVQTAQIDESVRGVKLPDNIVKESIAYIAAHEAGHCLGFMHNMAASAAYPVESLRDPNFTQKYGTTPSIMDYARFNYIAQPGDKGVKLTPPDLGRYDELLVKYAYKSIIDAKSSREEQKTLESWIDEKAGDPVYRYGKQQVIQRYDPSAIEEDLGDDPIKAANYGVNNLKYILSHLNEWIPNDVDPDASHREGLYLNIANQYNRYLKSVMLNVGGIYLSEVKPGTAGKRAVAVPKERQREALLWVLNQMKTCDWIANQDVTGNFSLRVGLSPIFKYYTSLEIFDTYKNVMLSSHISDNPYTVKEYFDDVYNVVWESAIKGRKVTEADKLMQRLFLDASTDVVTKKGRLIKVGLVSEDDSYSPSIDHIRAFNLDPTGMVDKYFDQLVDIEREKGKGYIASQFDLTSFGYGYGWQPRVNLRSIDESKSLFYGENLRILNLLKSRIASSVGETKTHYQTMVYVIEDSMKKQ